MKARYPSHQPGWVVGTASSQWLYAQEVPCWVKPIRPPAVRLSFCLLNDKPDRGMELNSQTTKKIGHSKTFQKSLKSREMHILIISI